jgi:Flp pilus assembly protein TadB
MPSFPAESNSTSEKNVAVSSEKPKTESENKPKTETKTVTAKELTNKMEANYEANKKEMSLKERIANKFLIKQLKKAVKKDTKSPDATKDSTKLFHILGILLIVLGVVSLIFLNLYGGIVTIVIGIFIYLLPELM